MSVLSVFINIFLIDISSLSKISNNRLVKFFLPLLVCNLTQLSLNGFSYSFPMMLILLIRRSLIQKYRKIHIDDDDDESSGDIDDDDNDDHYNKSEDDDDDNGNDEDDNDLDENKLQLYDIEESDINTEYE